MAEERVQRRLAAILAADVAGYSRLMGTDETGTRTRFNAHLSELIEPAIASRQGRIVNTAGDGLLVEFASVVDAVQCAIDLQNGMEQRNSNDPDDRRIEFRIGVNLGDVIIEGDDIHGDGVNVAARLEGIAEPGGVCISGKVYEEVRDRIDLALVDLGEQEVKNISRPVRVWRWSPAGVPMSGLPSTNLELPDKPSIAVLPLQNMSGDPEQEYFSDGITEDLITALSRIRWLFVVARNSTFSYKGQAPDVRDVARELGVRYVLEGSVRKSGTRVRMTTQLIDGISGNHIWAERYDRDLEDVFALQDELALTLCGAIEPELAKSEQQRVLSKVPENMETWDYYQRGMWLLQKARKTEIAEARGMFERAMELDPSFGPAFVGYVGAYSHYRRLGYSEGDREKALQAARRAVDLDSEDAWSHWALGAVYHVDPKPEAAISEFSYAIQLNPSFADAHAWLGDSLSCAGRAEEAISPIEQAIRLSPRDPLIGIMHARMGRAYLFLRQHEKSVEWSKSALRHQNVGWPAAANLASALGHLGRLDEARHALGDMLRLQPGITIAFVQAHTTVTHSDYMDHFVDGLRKAGLTDQSPEQDESLPLPDKPSIAVLPFQNMSGDPEQEYFSDGITEDIITALSRIRQFFVIARNTTFTYKGQSVDVQAVAREMGVRYVLEGSVRKAGSRVRISAQLIDGTTGTHLWAERYDRDLEDVFAVQDEITLTVVGAMQPELSRAEQERAWRKPPGSLDAWDFFQQGLSQIWKVDKSGNEEARRLLRRAIDIDPTFSPPHAYLAYATVQETTRGLSIASADELEEASEHASRAVELDETDATAHWAKGLVSPFMQDYELAKQELRRAIDLNPSFSEAYLMLGSVLTQDGRPDEAIPVLETTIRLSPNSPLGFAAMAYLGRAHLHMGELEEARRWAEMAVRHSQAADLAYLVLLSTLGYLGLEDEARAVRKTYLARRPAFTISDIPKRLPYRRHEDGELVSNGLRKAGLPD